MPDDADIRLPELISRWLAKMADLHHDSKEAEKIFESERADTETHVKGVEEAADKGLLSRKLAERVIGAGQKAVRSHDLTRGVGRNE